MKSGRSARLRRPSRAAVGWVAALAGAAALQVWVHLKTTELGYEIGLLRRASLRLVAERGELEAEVAALTSPRALDAVARTRFHLHPPRDGQTVAIP